jgi:hypothetical protein
MAYLVYIKDPTIIPTSPTCFSTDFSGELGDPPDPTKYQENQNDLSLGFLNGFGSLAYDSPNNGNHGQIYSRWSLKSPISSAVGTIMDAEISWEISYFRVSNSGITIAPFIGFSQSSTSVSQSNIIGLLGINITNSPTQNTIRYYVHPVTGQPATIGPTISTSLGTFTGKLRVKYEKPVGASTQMHCWYMTDGVHSSWQFLTTRSVTRTATHYLHYGFATGNVTNSPEVRGVTTEVSNLNILEASESIICPNL